MKTIYGIAIAAVLTLLNAAVTAAKSPVAPELSGNQPDTQQLNVCSDYSIPCYDSRVWYCSRCINSYSVDTTSSWSDVTYVNQNGTPTVGGWNSYEDPENPRPATPEEIAAVMGQLATLMENYPKESPERDRMAAAIFRDHHFPLAEVELLQGVVAASIVVNPDDVANIESAYEFMGMPDVFVDYGDWLNRNLPAYQFPLVDLYCDPNAIVRQRFAKYGVDYFQGIGDLSNATRYEAWEDNLQGQLDTSLLEGIVLIEMP